MGVFYPVTLESSTPSFHFACLSEIFTLTGLPRISKTHLRLHFSPSGMACPNLRQLPKSAQSQCTFLPVQGITGALLSVLGCHKVRLMAQLPSLAATRFLTGRCHFQHIFITFIALKPNLSIKARNNGFRTKMHKQTRKTTRNCGIHCHFCCVGHKLK